MQLLMYDYFEFMICREEASPDSAVLVQEEIVCQQVQQQQESANIVNR